MSDDGTTIEIFFDGDCPLCTREIRIVRRLDRARRIRFTDIAAEGFDAEAIGTTHAALMEQIRARLPDGTWLEGVEVFRRMYAAVGFHRLIPVTRLPGVAQLLELGYERFAKNRLRWTGRCDADDACAIRPADLAKAGS